MDSADVGAADACEQTASLTKWDDPPAPLANIRPAALAADAGRPQPFLHVMLKAITLAKAAHDAELAGRPSSTKRARFAAFMGGLSEQRFADVRAFLAWAAEAAGDKPGRDLAGFARRFAKRLDREPVLRSMWDGALCRPRNFAKDAHLALYWAGRLDIELFFPALPSDAGIHG